MSESAPAPEKTVFRDSWKIAIVASRFNENYVDGLIEHARAVFRAEAPAAAIKLWRVPGAFEIPLMVAEVASSSDAVLALGVILQGETKHAVHLASSVTQALQRLSLETRKPIIHGVLDLENDRQARVRCLEDKMNRGSEAARSALQMLHVCQKARAGE